MNSITEFNPQADALARDVLTLSQNTLMVNLRFLDRALYQFVNVYNGDTTLATDGESLFYDYRHVLLTYKKAKEEAARDYLHVVFHCILNHLFVGGKIDKEIWDVACDISVENSINELSLKCVKCERETAQQKIIENLKKEIRFITAEKVYRYFKDKNISLNELTEIRKLFIADDHSKWYAEDVEDEGVPEEEKQENEDGNSNDDSGDIDIESYKDTEDDGTENPDSSMQENGEGEAESEIGQMKLDESGEKGKAMSREEIEKLWKDISEQVKTDLETASKQWGDKAKDLTQGLRECGREKYDYADFLRQFSIIGEEMQINDDEFDYIFYTYGLKLYENMPLIESLEYKEVKRVKEFVIAIDTSGSVRGDIVQKFITKTYNILKQAENFFTKINIHIIQCDCEIQEDKKITSQEEFDSYMRTMTLKGFGGTDFRPVFEHVDEMIEKEEFSNLRGLIYFTDGYGNFPAKQPDYSTAFVFVDDDYNEYDVPVWAIRLLLGTEDIEEF